MVDAQLADEKGRLAALSALAILDTGPEPEFDHITELAKAVLGVPVAAVTLISAHRQWFKSVEGADLTECPRETSFCTVTIQRREPMIVENAMEHERFQENPFVTGSFNLRSYIGVPLALPNGYQVGALCGLDTEPRTFTDAQLEALKNLARCVEKELALRLKATVDDLTGCLARGSFLEVAERVRSRALLERKPASLAILDLDHFKSINDRFGHDVGDVVLRETASRFVRELAGEADIGRIGGEEFAAVLPGFAAEEAAARLQTLRRQIPRTEFPAAKELSVTVSMGVTEFLASDREILAAFKRADQALYDAKRSGRNRIEVRRADVADGSAHPTDRLDGLTDDRARDAEADDKADEADPVRH